MLVSKNFYRPTYKGLFVEIHRFERGGSIQIARRVYHPTNHAWLECNDAKHLRRTCDAIARNVRITQTVSLF